MKTSRWSILLLILAILSMWGSSLAQAVQPTGGTTFVYLPLISRPIPSLNDAIKSVEPVASSGVFTSPFDATPNLDGSMIYFTATDAKGASLYQVSSTGGTVTNLTAGSPFTTPTGLAMATNGATLYIADTHAVISSTQTTVHARTLALAGELFRVPATGGTPTSVVGSGNTAPRGLDVVSENGVEMIYFTGVDPTDGVAAVMKIPAVGGAVTILDKGDGLVEPTGIVVAKNGLLYVTDQKFAGNGLGAVLRINPSHPHRSQQLSHREILYSGLRMGDPAGVALTEDESLVLVSALDSNRDSSQVFIINTSTLQQGVVTKVVETNSGSGGLHRARNSSVFAWAGYCRKCDKDSVYLVTPVGD